MSKTSLMMSRRSILRSGAAFAGVASLAAPFRAFAQLQSVTGFDAPVASPYGALSPVNDLNTGLPLLQLPPGFSYRSFGWSGDKMHDGQPTPYSHDGMAVVEERGPLTMLIRNHESSNATNLAGEPLSVIGARGVYDDIAGDLAPRGLTGGTTTLVLRNGELYKTLPSLGGTIVNCAGGPTPWGTWLSCEETTTDLRELGGKKHGYVFEVAWNGHPNAAKPIVGMGRMSHEAVAIDPFTGDVYLTEDRRNVSGFYKYVPDFPQFRFGALEKGGSLYGAKVVGQDNADLNAPSVGDSYKIEWVKIDDPDADPAPYADDVVNDTASGPFLQARAKGGIRMGRGEGAWYSRRDGFIYFVDTAGGVDDSGRPGRGHGSVWAFNPTRNELACIYASTNAVAGNNPDNITVSPRGGIVLCEDGGGVEDDFGFGERLLGLTPNGAPFILAKNNIVLDPNDIARAGKNANFIAAEDHRDKEWCGANFNSAGDTLYVNIQTPGITFAIRGPWTDGPL